MSAHLARAQLLLAQSRPADAERETMLALAAQPDDVAALALLSLSRSEQRKGPESLAAAETAIGLAPDNAYLHYVHAVALHRLDREADARLAIGEALRLDPGDEDHFALLSSIELARRDWPAALEAADQALALNPEHVNAANLRAMALVRLGRKEEATATVDFALHRAPENAFSHANQGWNCLHRNDPRRAQEHFREALRLEPDLEYARHGMLEALKARNPVYRAMLAYFLWIGRQSRQFQWAFVIGTYLTSRFIGRILAAPGGVATPILVLVVLFYALVYLSWTSMPMFNLLLRFDRFGRLVLSRDERHGTWWFGATFAVALGSLIWWPLGGGEFAVLNTIVWAMLSVCAAATFNRTKRPRLILAIYSGVLALFGLGGLALVFANPESSINLLTPFFFGFLGFQFLANFVSRNG